ncbi:hypothetical protein V1477_003240 [Vespula maculifrons]|uniref:Uncharacterized protein n=1 Tax=Vespula maculifrons TaxID=7453 RepID=A0ABD2CU30_VESMC
MSDIIISEECVLRELRCVLFEIQGKTEPLTIKIECVLRELRCVLVEIRSKTEPLTIKIGRTFDFVVISRNPVSPLHNFILKPNKSFSLLLAGNACCENCDVHLSAYEKKLTK